MEVIVWRNTESGRTYNRERLAEIIDTAFKRVQVIAKLKIVQGAKIHEQPGFTEFRKDFMKDFEQVRKIGKDWVNAHGSLHRVEESLL